MGTGGNDRPVAKPAQPTKQINTKLDADEDGNLATEGAGEDEEEAKGENAVFARSNQTEL